MANQGATFIFKKKASVGEESPSPSAPDDNTAPAKGTDTAGERHDSVSLKSYLSADKVINSVVKGVNAVTNNVSGSSYLQAQAAALNQGLAQGASLALTAVVSPWAAGVQALAMIGEYQLNEYKFSLNKALNDYDLEEYHTRRGYSSSRSR